MSVAPLLWWMAANAPIPVEPAADPALAGSVAGLALPDWLTAGDEDCRLKSLETVAFSLSGGRTLVVQQAPLCASARCAVHAGTWEPVDCPQSAGTRFGLESLGQDLWLLYSYQEGPGEGRVIWWRPGAPEDVLLPHVSVPGAVPSRGGGWVLESHCDPATGLLPEPIDEPGCAATTCGFCASNFGKTYRWRWRPGEAPERTRR